MTPAEKAAAHAARAVRTERERTVFATVERVGADLRAREAPRQAMSQAQSDNNRTARRATESAD